MRSAAELIALSEQTARELPLREKLRWEMLERNDGSCIILPSKVQPFLYRGQNQRFSPCWPSVCRGFRTATGRVFDLERSEQLLLIQRMAQGLWFQKVLDEHPAIRWASEQNVYVDRSALAQHYGITTSYVDVTENFDVAAFFATCYFDRGRNEWRPCESGDGIFYGLDWRRIPREPKRIKWIGLQPLPRPSEQWAATCELFLGEDFEQAPGLSWFPFTHSAQAGEHFLYKFDGGETLFPSDPIARVAERINQASRFPLWALKQTIEDLTQDAKGLPNAHEDQLLLEIESGLGVIPDKDCASPLMVSDIAELDAIWRRNKDSFFHRVGFRLAREPRQQSPL